MTDTAITTGAATALAFGLIAPLRSSGFPRNPVAGSFALAGLGPSQGLDNRFQTGSLALLGGKPAWNENIADATAGTAALTGVAGSVSLTAAFLGIVEYGSMLNDASSGSSYPRTPPVNFQYLAYGSTVCAQSAPFSTQTHIIRIAAAGTCMVMIGGKWPVASTTLGQRMVSGNVEYFVVQPGDRLAVIVTT